MTELPPPDAQSRAHSAAMVDAIRAAIDLAGGAISFAEYMQLALYAPGLGYYVSGRRKFGSGGDFVTAPEVSTIYARCVARQAADVLNQTGGDVLEFGAGTGVFATAILAELDALDCLPGRYRILEVSPDLKQTQRRTIKQELPHLLSRVEWLDSWPQSFSGFIFANEVLDAMPVERFRHAAGGTQQAFVTWDQELMMDYRAAGVDLTSAIDRVRQSTPEPWDEGFESEINLLLRPWLAECARCAEHAGILLVDYGYPRASYYHPMRVQGTLRCHYQHRAHDDALFLPGLQDITAHVDFTAVAEAGAAVGLAHEGFVTQQQLLINCGLEEVGSNLLEQADERARIRLSQEIRQLTLPGAMGEAFHAIGLSKHLDSPMRGFSSLDRSRFL